MKLLAVPVLFSFMAAVPPQAAATVATLGVSRQTFSLTGIGSNASGQGQSKMTWGSCAFDGTNTNCTLSGAFTGFGGGGNYSFVLSYPGNGAFPSSPLLRLAATSFSPRRRVDYFLIITLVENSGTTIKFYSFANFNFVFSSPTCTGVTTCTVGQVGLTPNATITGPIGGGFDPTPAITPSGVIAGNYGAFPAIGEEDRLVGGVGEETERRGGGRPHRVGIGKGQDGDVGHIGARRGLGPSCSAPTPKR